MDRLKFFGSKLNTGLLFVLIILTVIAIHIMLQNKELYFPKSAQHTVTQVNTPKASYHQGKFFDMVDTYTANKDIGTPSVVFMKPEAHLILFLYATSQETAEYGVYNFKTDEIFTGIGYSSIGGSEYPIAFIGNDKLLAVVQSEQDSGIRPPKLVIEDFKNNVTATVTGTMDPKFEFYHEAYGFNDTDGYMMVTFQTTSDFIPQVTKYKTYKINEKTYQLSENR